VLVRLVLTEIELFKNVKIDNEMNGRPDAVSGGHTFLCNF